MSLNGNQDENSQIENRQEMQVEQVERDVSKIPGCLSYFFDNYEIKGNSFLFIYLI
jgi:hypothetical protein